MTFDEVRQQIERLRTINRAIDRIGDRVADLRSKAEGVHAQRFDTVRSCSGRHDAFESGVIDYVEKTAVDRARLIELQCERFDLEFKLSAALEETENRAAVKMIYDYFQSFPNMTKGR